MIKIDKKRLLTEYIPLFTAFISIVVCSIVFKQDLIKAIPACISLVIGLLSSRANKICYIMGACNCMIYIIGYFMEKLYGSALQTLFSCVLQITTFFYWTKNSYKHATMFRKMRWWGRVLMVVSLIVGTVVCALVLQSLNASEVWLDSFLLVSGVLGPILTLFAFLEYLPLALLCQLMNDVMWFKIMISGSIANITYLILAVYNTYITIRLTKTWLRLYKEQQGLNNNK